MRVAICLSGQVRSAKECFPFIYENIIKPNNADVFFHTYFDPSNLYMEKTHIDRGDCFLHPKIIEEIISLYKPVAYLVEKPKNLLKPSLEMSETRLKRSIEFNSNKNWSREQHKHHIIKQMMSMFYSIFKANELKENYANENGFIYDYVIRVRFDLVPLTPLNCSLYDKNKIYFLNLGHPDNLISDWINFGSNLIMNIYASIYLHIEYLLSPNFYLLKDRFPSTIEASDTCGGYYEYMVRDIMSLHNIESRTMNLHCILSYNT